MPRRKRHGEVIPLLLLFLKEPLRWVLSGVTEKRIEKGYRACVDEVRVERRGKSSPDGWELSVAVNSIRSNTGMGAHRLARPLPGWLERAGNGTSR